MIFDYLYNLDKKNLYESYSKIVDSPKDYKKIISRSIIEEVIEYYNSSYEVLTNICSYQEIRLLYRIVNKELDYEEIINDIHSSDLISKLLLIIDNNKKIAFVPDEYHKIIKEAYKKMDKEDLSNKESINTIIIGLFRIYGILDFDSLFEILSNYIVIDKEVLESHVESNKYIKFYIDKITHNKKFYYIFRAYKDLSDILFTGLNTFKDLDYKIRPFEEVVYLRYNSFYNVDKKIGEFINIFSKLDINLDDLYNSIIVSVVLDDDRKDVVKLLKKYLKNKSADIDSLIMPLNNAMDNMPSSVLKGYTRSEYLEEVADKKYDKEYDKIRYNNDIIRYKEIREKADSVINEAMYYAFKENLSDKFNDVIKDNKVFFLESDTHVVENLLLFHKIKDEESIFDIFYSKKINIFFPYYEMFKEYKDSYLEGLFKITKVSKDGYIIIKDDKKEYKVYDIALSQNKHILNNYIYTSIVTIEGVTFTTNYAFILKDIKKKKDKYKGITNNKTIDYLSYYELFRDLNIDLVDRNLE